MSRPTFQKRLAFDDTDLRTPKHDEIMQWLCNILENGRYLPPHPGRNLKFSKLVWEQPIIAAASSYVVGFFDLAAYFTYEEDHEVWEGGTWVKETWDTSTVVYFEVKSQVPSLGELLRQLQFYRAHTRSRHIVVVAPPSDALQHLLLSQDFGYLPAPLRGDTPDA